jgi:DNA-binding CsgD family transcriptional regulator
VRAEGVYELTDREFEILEFKCRSGMNNYEVGQRFGITHHTVGRTLRNCYRLMGVHSQSQACWLMGLTERPSRWSTQ